MYLQKSGIKISRLQQELLHYILAGTRWWLLPCLLVGSLSYGFAQPSLLFADSPPVNQEIRCRMPEAEEVFLIWGINGWNVTPEEMRPAGTVVKKAFMWTPMIHQGDTFIVKVQVPAGTTIDYGFLITKKRDGSVVQVWEANGDQDYHTVATRDGVIEVQTRTNLIQGQTSGDNTDSALVSQKFHYHMPEASEVFLIWGINGWGMVPKAIQPAETVMKDALMHTPMTQEKDTFSAKVQVPVGATINYGFLITKKQNGVAIEAVWDGDQYKPIIATEDNTIEIYPTVTLALAREILSVFELGLYLFVRVSIVISGGIFLVLVPWKYNQRTVVLLLFVLIFLGLMFRFYAAWDLNTYHPDGVQRLVGDESGYDGLAREILHDFSFSWPARVPLYPLWLAAIYLFTNGSYHAVPYVQSFLGVTVIPLTYLLGRRVFGYNAGLLAAFLAAISYGLIGESLHLLSEVLYVPIILLVAITLWDALREPTAWRFGWAGFWVGISNLVRPTLLLFPIAVVVLFVIILSKRQVIRYWAIYVLTATLVIMPWIARNYVHYQTFFPLQTSNAILWQGSPEYYHLIKEEGYTYQRIWAEILHGPAWNAPDPTSIEGDRWWTKRALQSIKAEPLVYMKYIVEKLGTYWVGDSSADWGNSYVFDYQALRRMGFTQWDAIMVMIDRALPILALLTIFIVRHKWRSLLPIYALLIYTTLLHAATHAEARLSEPFLPFLLVLIAGGAAIYWVPAAQNQGKAVTASFRTLLYGSRLVYLRDLLRELVIRDIKLRYKRSVLGVAWSLLNPLAQLLIFTFLFRKVLPLNIPNYPLFVFSGVLAWSWFQSSLFLATGAITDNRELIRRPGFPVAILPVVTVVSNLIHFLLALPVLLLFVLLGGIQLTSASLALPLVIVLQFILTLSLAYLVATFHVNFRDTQHLLGVLLLLFFYLTPVFYDASVVPAQYQWFYRLNPLAYLIEGYRSILMRGQLPDGLSLLVLGIFAIGMLGLGYVVFTRASYRFVEEL